MSAMAASVVYECLECEERFVDERRGSDCNVFCRRLGAGGRCLSCGEAVATDELVAG